jgi:hypothetical protein
MMAVAPIVDHDDITAVVLLLMPILLIAMALIGTGSARLRLAWIPSSSYSIQHRMMNGTRRDELIGGFISYIIVVVIINQPINQSINQ